MHRGFRFPDPLSENMLSELSLVDVANITQKQFLALSSGSKVDAVKYQRVPGASEFFGQLAQQFALASGRGDALRSYLGQLVGEK